METWLVVSNCHTESIANSIRIMKQDVQVHAPDVWEFIREISTYFSAYRNYDRVIISPEILVIDELKPFNFQSARELIWLPTFFFTAYHPDCVFLYKNGNVVRGVLDVCHSAIIVASHKAGHSVDKTLSLFNINTYRNLGYLSLWDSQRKLLVARFAKYGIDISSHFIKWSRNDCFMYSTDHPKIEPVYDSVAILMKSKGIKFDQHGLLPNDSLTFPPKYAVYSEIAENLGIKGGYWFKGVGPASMSLEQFIVSSFRFYDENGDQGLTLSNERSYIYDYIARI